MYPEFHLRYKQKGIGLPMAIFVITILALITLGITSLQENNGLSMAVDVNSQRAFFAAESGSQIALSKVFPPSGVGAGSCTATQSTIWSGNFTVPGLARCSAVVTCVVDTVSSKKYDTFVSTGQCGSGADAATRVIEVRARQ